MIRLVHGCQIVKARICPIMGTQRAPALTAIAVPVGGPTPRVRSRALSGPRGLPPFGGMRGRDPRLRSDTCNAVDAVIAESVDDSTAAPRRVCRCASAFSDVGKP